MADPIYGMVGIASETQVRVLLLTTFLENVMIAFTESRRIIVNRRAIQDLSLLDMNSILLGWIEDSKVIIIREAERIELRNTRVQARNAGAVLVG